jgi:tetratricopeptide (TPR) repeat protein/tRNA A-37 threonylcarbamoyl transferase component Bud32
MDAARHRKATQVFQKLCELPDAERERGLTDACGGDLELEKAVRALLEADTHGTGFLEASPARVMREAAERVPDRVGPFKVLGVLGRGAMGTVYEAEQETPRRRVAVKVLQPGLLSRSLLERFRYEAEILGRLQHTGIAQVYAAGTEQTPAGERPWMAMELVRGASVERYARESKLAWRAVLELVARIADAVHHAHQRGIVHRDLKSANVLVQENGDPKVLDFGVARAQEADVRATLATQPGLLVGTLATMSPEQAGATADLDARTDIYSLGAIAYELLAGRPPLELSGLPLPRALVAIAEQEPPRLGTLVRAIPSDVEAVVAKALEKDRERRYSSAAAFAEDLKRAARGAPVAARPQSTLYLASKLVRRHRAASVALGLAVVGLLAFALQSVATARSDRRAREEAETSAAIDHYVLRDLLESPDPRVLGRDIRVVDVLGRAADGVEEAFPDQPHVQAAVRRSLGRSFFALGEFERSLELLQPAVEWLRGERGARDPQVLEAETELVEVLTALDRREEGIAQARESLTKQNDVLGPDHVTTLRTAAALAALYLAQGNWDEAETLLGDVIPRLERIHGADDRDTLLAREGLCAVLHGQGRVEESLALRRECLDLRTKRYGERDPETLIARAEVARAQVARKELADPVGTLEELVDATREVFGPRHEQTVITMGTLAAALEKVGRGQDAAGLRREVLDVFVETLGEQHAYTLDARFLLAKALLPLGDAEEAAALAAECVAALDAEPGAPIHLGRALVVLGEASLGIGEKERAGEALERAIEVLETAPGPSAASYMGRAKELLQGL